MAPKIFLAHAREDKPGFDARPHGAGRAQGVLASSAFHHTSDKKGQPMLMIRRLVLGAALLALVGCASSEPADQAAQRAEIDSGADAALNQLYAEDPAVRTLADRAKGIAIFPNIVKAGFGVGGETGDGVLRAGGESVAYYNTSGASIGLQIGAQSYSQVLMFLTDDALARFRDSAGWEAGVDGSVAVLKTGAGGKIDTTNISEPVVGFVFGQQGLMADATIEGSKYTKLDL
jgi:lipid-binding SYLF domain-containing protein